MSSKLQISVGNIKVGGGAPITVQTMTNSNTENVEETIRQVNIATKYGCDLIRISCPTIESTSALKKIISHSSIPVIADIHFNYKRAIEAINAGADCIRINPGNTSEYGIKEIVRASINSNTSIRIGINSGSIERNILDKYGESSVDAIVESAVTNCKKLEDLGFLNFKVSVKSSDVKTSIESYRKLSKKIDYPLHLGITEAGTLFSGTIKSAIGIGSLLSDGIGDTIRVSLSSDICDEIRVGKQILKSLNLLRNSINVVSCPTCSRTIINVIKISKELEEYCDTIENKTNNLSTLKITVLGCVVNGIGEAMNADIGVFGFKENIAKIYFKGTEYCTVSNDNIVNTVKELINIYKKEK